MCIPKKPAPEVKPKQKTEQPKKTSKSKSEDEGEAAEQAKKAPITLKSNRESEKKVADKKMESKEKKESARDKKDPSKEPPGMSKEKGKSFRPMDKKSKKMCEEWIAAVLNKGVEPSVAEFRSLAKWKPENMTTEACMANKEKNRYLDVPCQDEKRVILKHPGLDSDFIHANYVKTLKNEKRFICTQGPLEGTQFAFWAMVVQENVHSVVMLCNTIECGKLKCFQYWPASKGETMKFGEGEGEILVTNNSSGPLSATETTIRKTEMTLKWKTGEREIRHYQWENWPDRGVPPSATTAVHLIEAFRGDTTPILVHCSAGIGRTGTIVAIAYVQEKMQNGQSCMAMDELLKNIRSQRPFSIQNEMQYLYLHRVVLMYFLEKHKELFQLLEDPENKAKYEQWCADYDKATMQK